MLAAATIIQIESEVEFIYEIISFHWILILDESYITLLRQVYYSKEIKLF